MVAAPVPNRTNGLIVMWTSVAGLLITMLIGPAVYSSFATPFPIIPYFSAYIFATSWMAVLVLRTWRHGQRMRAVVATLVVLLTLAIAYDNWYSRQLQPNGSVKISDIRWW